MSHLDWKLVKSDYIFKAPWCTVRNDTCLKPDGKIVENYYVMEFPAWVTALAITEDGKIILERQYRHALGRTDIELPGGCVDDTDASFQDAIARELLEETGYVFTEYKYLGNTSANPSTNNNLMHMFIATGGKKISNQHLDENEEIDVFLVTPDELKTMIKQQQIIQSMHVTTIWYAMQHLGWVNW